MSDLYVPEISYANTDPETVKSQVLTTVENDLERKLATADPLRLFALAFASESVVLRNLIDEAGRQNLLYYATGDNLDALGDLIGVTRLSPKGAATTLRFTAATPATSAITIPAGTRATPGGQIYFATDYAATIAVGQQYVDVPATCVTNGTAGNGCIIGEIDQIVDPVAYVPTVSNTTASAGGYDAESDDALRERIRLGVTQFSVAGSRDAYEYWARSASAQISDVYVVSPSAGAVDVYILLVGGELPGDELKQAVTSILTADTVRPLTDQVTVKAPALVDYTLEVSYYIRNSDAARASEIQTAVEAAINGWVLWQRSAIGRDLNPSELIARIIQAGAKRAAVTSPAYTAISATSIAHLSGTATVTYGGMEDG
ncbi:MAG: baseplate J/gp47 family protein [Armatimonadota bacterium]